MRLLLCLCAFVCAEATLIPRAATASSPTTFASAGADAAATLLHVYYAGDGAWHECDRGGCGRASSDWGADALTDVLFMRWESTRDPAVRSAMEAIGDAMPQYGAPCDASACPRWSDTPAWDAVTLMRVYEATREARFLKRAQAALRYISASSAFGGGACPQLPYQRPHGTGKFVKTLETDANATKAALLVYRATGDRRYLDDALARYAADRRAYLDPSVPLYSVHVIDDGTTCEQVPRRFFASVNGDMIWNGVELAGATGDRTYFRQAMETAQAVDSYLSDGRGVFADLEGDNDVEEPLVEAMADLAAWHDANFARAWILRNAAAALGSRAADGAFARFFDGPATTASSAWAANGGLALEIAAASLDGQTPASAPAGWSGGGIVTATVTQLPATIAFDGSGIALVGTISARCERQHLRVYVDGAPTFDRTGLWQNPSMPGGSSVLFAWRWAAPGHHTIRLEPGSPSELGPGVLQLQGLVSGDPAGSARPPPVLSRGYLHTR